MFESIMKELNISIGNKGNKQIMKGDNNSSFVTEKIIININNNKKIIKNAKINKEMESNIDDLDHLSQIKEFIRTGISGTTEVAIFVRDLLPSIFKSKTHAKRQEIIDSLNIIMESNDYEKYVLRWCWILRKIKISSLYGEKIKQWFLENRKNENQFCNLIRHGTPNLSTYTLNKYGMIPFFSKNLNHDINEVDLDFEIIGPISCIFKSKEEFFKFYPQLKVAKVSIYQYEMFLSGPLEIAAETLINQLGIEINNFE